MQKKITVKFVDFWPGFDERNNFLAQALQKHFDLVFDDERPEYLIFSCFGSRHFAYTDYSCIKIFFTGENLVPNFNECDYALGFEFLEFGDRYLRYPLFATHQDLDKVFNRGAFKSTDLDRKSKFCNFIYSNNRADPVRDAFFYKLSDYKNVDAAGNHLRNVTHVDQAGKTSNRSQNKVAFLKDYKFTIAFENSACEGYTTEKIFDAFAGRTIPIYWGNSRVSEDFNQNAFIDASRFDGEDALLKEVIRIDNDDEEYLRIINEPAFLRSYNPNNSYADQLADFLQNIVTQPLCDARRRPKHGRVRMLEMKRRKAAFGIIPFVDFSKYF